MKRHAAVAALFATLSLTSADVMSGDCAEDSDCGKGQVCTQGGCVSLSDTGPSAGAQSGKGSKTKKRSVPTKVKKVTVGFRGEPGYVVSTTDADGERVRCEVPCYLSLPPGEAEIVVLDHFTDTVEIPDHDVTFELKPKRKGLLVGGIVTTAVGAALVGGGALAWRGGECTDKPSGSPDNTPQACGEGGVVFMVAGGVVMAVGIGLLIPGLLSTGSLKVVEDTTTPAWLPRNVHFGVAPRREGGAFAAATLVF